MYRVLENFTFLRPYHAGDIIENLDERVITAGLELGLLDLSVNPEPKNYNTEKTPFNMAQYFADNLVITENLT